MNEPDVAGERRALTACPLCGGRGLHYVFSRGDCRVVRCSGCALLFLNPQPSDDELGAIYTPDYFLGGGTPEARARVAAMKSATARQYLSDLERYRGSREGRLLEIGCGQGDLLFEAQQQGYVVAGFELSASAASQANERLGRAAVQAGGLDATTFEPGQFDVCVLSDVIEHMRDPVSGLAIVHRLLKPGGTVFIATPSLDSWSARLLRQNWMEFKPEHLTYFDSRTIQHLLFRCGYHECIVRPAPKVLSLEYIAHHFDRFPVPVVGGLVRTTHRLAPRGLRDRHVRVVASGLTAMARATPVPERRLLSVVVPAYNERGTFDTVMGGLLRKTIDDLDIEVIVVESGSTDGTREAALAYQGHPRVRLVLEDRPRGKGHAVRAGLREARGDFILIQDADLEYDLEDYDALVEPLRQGREAFVLGSRHGGSAWKMRSFTDQRVLSAGLNFGHWFFTLLVNVLFGTRLRDPFTMFKVFRRDCLYGLTFECNRFDFDYELLIKLVRKGYRPIEIPVNYRSRSFQEGKKVSIWRDPLTWLRALARLRLATIDPLREVERQRQAAAPVAEDAPSASPALAKGDERT